MEKTKKNHFVLVHGGCHGAWCWYKLSTLLRSAGDHRVTALDMAASGVDPKRVEELGSISDYFKPLMDFMGSLPIPREEEEEEEEEERVILVGHSYGGVGISLAMERFPAKISVAVFITAFMPGPTLTFHTIGQEFYEKLNYLMDKGPGSPPTSFIFRGEVLASNLYELSPPEDLTLATMLIRPLVAFSDADILKETVVSKEKYGSVRRVYIVIKEDKTIEEDFQRWMIENNPPDEVREITGSDHMVVLSKPQEICATLLSIAQN